MFSHFCRSGFINTLLGGDPRTTEISFIRKSGSSDRPEKTRTDRSLSFPNRDFPMIVLLIRSILGGLKIFDLGGDPHSTEISFIRERGSSDRPEKTWTDRSLSFPDRDFPVALLPIRSILGGLKMFDLGGDPRTTEISFIRECRSSDLSEKICID